MDLIPQNVIKMAFSSIEVLGRQNLCVCVCVYICERETDKQGEAEEKRGNTWTEINK